VRGGTSANIARAVVWLTGNYLGCRQSFLKRFTNRWLAKNRNYTQSAPPWVLSASLITTIGNNRVLSSGISSRCHWLSTLFCVSKRIALARLAHLHIRKSC